jgi:hypothetical protein
MLPCVTQDLPIEVESPEEFGYGNIRNNLAESSISDRKLSDLGLTIPDLTLLYTEHRGSTSLRALIARDGAGLDANDVLVTTGAAGAHCSSSRRRCSRPATISSSCVPTTASTSKRRARSGARSAIST